MTLLAQVGKEKVTEQLQFAIKYGRKRPEEWTKSVIVTLPKMILSGQLSGHMELERDWLKFCRISAKERSQQCKLVENWETSSEPWSVRDKEIRYRQQLSSFILKE